MGTRSNILVIPSENDAMNLPAFNPDLIPNKCPMEEVEREYAGNDQYLAMERQNYDLTKMKPLGISSVPKGKGIRIYCQCDGYFDGIGIILLEQYNDPAKALNLVLAGSLEGLATHYHPCLYTRTGGKPLFDIADTNSKDVLWDAAYSYMWRNGHWYIDIGRYRRKALREAGFEKINGIPMSIRWMRLDKFAPVNDELTALNKD